MAFPTNAASAVRMGQSAAYGDGLAQELHLLPRRQGYFITEEGKLQQQFVNSYCTDGENAV